MNILVTGGAGFIGSHCVVELLNSGHNVIIVDNFCNSKRGVINRIKMIAKRDFSFYEIDITNYSDLRLVFQNNKIDAIMHFAALKSGADSIENPGLYYQNNIQSTFNLVKLMEEFDVKYIVFSSSATVYGNSSNVPILETEEIGNVISPYGMTKYLCELYLKSVSEQTGKIKTVCLRYFNPVGAHPSGLIGEDSPDAVPNNLILYLLDVAKGKLPFLKIYGSDYNTPDGSGIRDYIHVVDLAKGHIAALDYLVRENKNFDVFNLGTGHGHTVLDVVNTFKSVTGVDIPYKYVERRPGDVEISYASVKKANELLKWHTKKTLADALVDVWTFKNKVDSFDAHEDK